MSADHQFWLFMALLGLLMFIPLFGSLLYRCGWSDACRKFKCERSTDAQEAKP